MADLFAEEIRKADLGPKARTAFPSAIANDANLAALAEHRHGAGRGSRHLLLVTSGHRGVGGALVIDGRLHTGSAGLALEVGHLTVDPQGRPCPCGNRGCLNSETDPDALFAAAALTPDPALPLFGQARELARATDPAARAAVDHVVDRLGLGLAGLANILNPDRIVLSGLHLDLLAAAPERLAAVVAERCLWGGADASRSFPRRSATRGWSAPPNSPGSRTSSTRRPSPRSDGGRRGGGAGAAAGRVGPVGRAVRQRSPGAGGNSRAPSGR